jgi:hypothetical protein
MSKQPHEPQVGEVVQTITADAYDGMAGIVTWILLPPPWIPEDERGEEYWIRINMALYHRGYFSVTVPFMRHELLTFEKEVPPTK